MVYMCYLNGILDKANTKERAENIKYIRRTTKCNRPLYILTN